MNFRPLLRGVGFLALAAPLNAAVPWFLSGAPASSGVEYATRYSPEADLTVGRTSIKDHRVSGNFVLSQSERETWMLQQSAGSFRLSESPVVPERALVVPDELWDIQTGIGYRRKFNERRDFTLSAGLGSASDKPYSSLHELEARFIGVYRLPASGRNSWMLAVAYSNNRSFLNNVPLPGAAYLYVSESRKVQAVLGFPFAAINYQATDDLAMRASLFGPRTLSAETAQRIRGPIKAYLGFNWDQLEWMRAHRNDYKNRIVYDEKRAVVGVRGPIAAGLKLDISGGRAFDRRFFENRSSDAEDGPRASLRNGWFVVGQLGYQWGLSPEAMKRGQ
jgi:hypothetical protein